MTPGSNLLKQAFAVISSQEFTYEKLDTNAVNGRGDRVPTYEAGIPVKGSVQSAPKEYLNALGLDWNKTYIMIYAHDPGMKPVGRGTAGDRVIFNGRYFQLETDTDWRGIDGWAGFLCVDIGAAT